MKTALLGFSTVNLGDDLQSIATALHLPFVDRLVDRDHLSRLRLDEKHFCLMQSWFTKERLRAPSGAIDPLFFGFCFGGDSMRYGLWPRYLRRHQPIGARDLRSIDLMRARNVEAFWSGCLTLRIGRFLRPVPREERKGVYMVDVLPFTEPLIPERIRSHAIALSNAVPPLILKDPLARMAQIARISDLLRHAAFVVTKRLHTALPCVGFGTPVLVLAKGRKGNRHRFSGYERFLPLHFLLEGEPAPDIAWNPIEPAHIPEELEAPYTNLKATLTARFGEIPEPLYDNLFQSDRLVLPNPGLGPETGRVAIDLGMARAERLPRTWTDREITIELDHFASFERFRLPILVQGSRSKEWIPVGTTDHFIAAARR